MWSRIINSEEFSPGGEPAEAIEHFRAALKLKSDFRRRARPCARWACRAEIDRRATPIHISHPHLHMRNNLLLALALAVVTFVVFAPVAQHDYINLDDQAYVPENPHINKGLTADGVRWAFTTHHGGSWHPVTWLSHMLDVQLFGLKAGPQHLMSAGIHAASAALLFLALFTMTQARSESFAVAALFALHPLRVESVAWVSERKDVLSGFWSCSCCWRTRVTRGSPKSKVQSPKSGMQRRWWRSCWG